MANFIGGILDISIHAPREGGDQDPLGQAPVIVISIHAPREGGDVDFRIISRQYK